MQHLNINQRRLHRKTQAPEDLEKAFAEFSEKNRPAFRLRYFRHRAKIAALYDIRLSPTPEQDE